MSNISYFVEQRVYPYRVNFIDSNRLFPSREGEGLQREASSPLTIPGIFFPSINPTQRFQSSDNRPPRAPSSSSPPSPSLFTVAMKSRWKLSSISNRSNNSSDSSTFISTEILQQDGEGFIKLQTKMTCADLRPFLSFFFFSLLSLARNKNVTRLTKLSRIEERSADSFPPELQYR